MFRILLLTAFILFLLRVFLYAVTAAKIPYDGRDVADLEYELKNLTRIHREREKRKSMK